MTKVNRLEQYIDIKNKYGEHSSWLIYDCNGLFPCDSGEEIVKKINLNYMFVALNPSNRYHRSEVFSMFHNHGNDRRLEYLSNNCEMVAG